MCDNCLTDQSNLETKFSSRFLQICDFVVRPYCNTVTMCDNVWLIHDHSPNPWLCSEVMWPGFMWGMSDIVWLIKETTSRPFSSNPWLCSEAMWPSYRWGVCACAHKCPFNPKSQTLVKVIDLKLCLSWDEEIAKVWCKSQPLDEPFKELLLIQSKNSKDNFHWTKVCRRISLADIINCIGHKHEDGSPKELKMRFSTVWTSAVFPLSSQTPVHRVGCGIPTLARPCVGLPQPATVRTRQPLASTH